MAKPRPVPQLPGEEWRQVPGHEGYYEVSSLGRVRSITVLRPAPNPQGYLTVNVGPGGNRTVHSLVAQAFIGPTPEKQEVRHLNGTRVNNRSDNLAYGTRQQNVDDMLAHGTNPHGESHWNAYLTEEVVSEIRQMAAADVPQCKIAKHFNISATTVTLIVSGRAWGHLRGRDHPLACDDRQGENWRPVPEYEGRYEVSDQGRVRSFITKGPHRGVSDVPQRMLRPRTDKHGYQKATLLTAQAHTTYSVHRMVALAFHGAPPEPSSVVRHLDGNRGNNWSDNLQWGTSLENALDRKRHGTNVRGSLSPAAVLTEENVRHIREARIAGASVADLAEMYQVSNSCIRSAYKGRTWKHVDGSLFQGRKDRWTDSDREAHRGIRLSPDKAREIREHLSGGLSEADVARMFGVSEGTVNKIKLGRIWSDGH